MFHSLLDKLEQRAVTMFDGKQSWQKFVDQTKFFLHCRQDTQQAAHASRPRADDALKMMHSCNQQ